jgi:hypothetical protein
MGSCGLKARNFPQNKFTQRLNEVNTNDKKFRARITFDQKIQETEDLFNRKASKAPVLNIKINPLYLHRVSKNKII